MYLGVELFDVLNQVLRTLSARMFLSRACARILKDERRYLKVVAF